MNNLTEANVTVELVERVSERMGTGVPLALALAGEPVSLAEYEEYLRANPEAAGLAGAAKRKFVQKIIGILLDADDPSANCRWLLERLYPEVFGARERERNQEKVQMQVTTVAGMSEEEVRLIQEAALKL